MTAPMSGRGRYCCKSRKLVPVFKSGQTRRSTSVNHSPLPVWIIFTSSPALAPGFSLVAYFDSASGLICLRCRPLIQIKARAHESALRKVPVRHGANLHTMTRDTLYIVITLAWLAVLAAALLYMILAY
jgi:hypothetical protein